MKTYKITNLHNVDTFVFPGYTNPSTGRVTEGKILGDVGRKVNEIIGDSKLNHKRIKIITENEDVAEVNADGYGFSLLRLTFPHEYYSIEVL